MIGRSSAPPLLWGPVPPSQPTPTAADPRSSTALQWGEPSRGLVHWLRCGCVRIPPLSVPARTAISFSFYMIVSVSVIQPPVFSVVVCLLPRRSCAQVSLAIESLWAGPPETPWPAPDPKSSFLPQVHYHSRLLLSILSGPQSSLHHFSWWFGFLHSQFVFSGIYPLILVKHVLEWPSENGAGEINFPGLDYKRTSWLLA